MSVRYAIVIVAICVACGPSVQDEPTWMLGAFTSPAPLGGRYDAPSNVGTTRFADDHTFVEETGAACGAPPDIAGEGTWELIDDTRVEYSYVTANGNEATYRLERRACNEFAIRAMNRGEWLGDVYLGPITRGEMCSWQEQCPGEDGELHNCDCHREFCEDHPEPEPFVCDDGEFPPG
jgi:hypothetical protein